MQVPAPARLMETIRALPAARPLLERLDGAPGVYLVGGAVRDLLLGAEPLDLDVLVDGDSLELARRLGGEVRAHDRFGTCTVKVDGAAYDLARSRRERYASPGALPEVEPASVQEDLRRRDFTVNALAVALGGPVPGELLAVAGAVEDLAARRLRVLHGRSFVDDPTRLLRLARYAARLGFEPDPDTAARARAAARDGALSTVSGERIGAELRLLAREDAALAALGWLRRLGVADALAHGFGCGPALAPGPAALELLPAGAHPERLVIALALRGVEEPQRGALLERLAFPAPDREAVLAIAGRADDLAQALARAGSPSAIAAAAGGAPPELVALAGALGPREPARAWLDELRDVRLEITGKDLLAAGVAAGPAIGRGLRAALAAKLDGRAGDRASELAVALAGARAPGRG